MAVDQLVELAFAADENPLGSSRPRAALPSPSTVDQRPCSGTPHAAFQAKNISTQVGDHAPLAALSASRHGIAAGSIPFVAGPENGALVAVLGSFMRTGQVSLSAECPALLLIVGPHGSGKSHVVHGIAKMWRRIWPAQEVICQTAIDFHRRFAETCQFGDSRGYAAPYQTAGLLVLEDIPHLAPKLAAKKLLKGILDARYQAGLPTILTSSLPLEKCLTPEDGSLVSRLRGGLLLHVAYPGDDARKRLLDLYGAKLGLTLSEEAQTLLLKRVPAPARLLESALGEIALPLHAMQNLMEGSPSNAPLRVEASHVEDWLRKQRKGGGTEMKHLAAVVAKNYGLGLAELRGSSRRKTAVEARSIAAYIAHRDLGMTYEQIGQALGKRDRTTVMHAVSKIHSLTESNTQVQSILKEFQLRLASLRPSEPS